jgi:uncharacterized membrane protein YvbJ
MICSGCGTQSAGGDVLCGGCGKETSRRVFRVGQALREQRKPNGAKEWRWSALLIPSALAFTLIGIVFLIFT